MVMIGEACAKYDDNIPHSSKGQNIWNLGKYDQHVVYVKQRQLHSYPKPGDFVLLWQILMHVHVFYETLLHIQKFGDVDAALYM